MHRAAVLGVALSVAWGCTRAPEPVPESALKRLTPDELEARLGQPGLAVYDANPMTLYERGHVPGAKWVAFDGVTADVLPADLAAPLVFYCANELCTASHDAAKAALKLGHRDVSLMPAGIMGWKKAGKRTEAVAAAP